MIQPRNDFVAIKLVRPGQSPGGVIIPERAQQRPEGLVVAFGPKVTDLKPGDQVVFREGAIGQKCLSDGEEVIVFREDDLMAVLADEKPARKLVSA